MFQAQINLLQGDLELMRRQKEFYERFYGPALEIYYGRIALSESAVLSGIAKIEDIFHAQNSPPASQS